MAFLSEDGGGTSPSSSFFCSSAASYSTKSLFFSLASIGKIFFVQTHVKIKKPTIPATITPMYVAFSK
jgi:hypothetical protein